MRWKIQLVLKNFGSQTFYTSVTTALISSSIVLFESFFCGKPFCLKIVNFFPALEAWMFEYSKTWRKFWFISTFKTISNLLPAKTSLNFYTRVWIEKISLAKGNLIEKSIRSIHSSKFSSLDFFNYFDIRQLAIQFHFSPKHQDWFLPSRCKFYTSGWGFDWKIFLLIPALKLW